MTTYNWNNRVSITVPVGLNGWYYSGAVTINGITTKFPVGVETTVPEPVAAMIQKRIEVEAGNKPVKPDNHYIGDVTIPEGKTLTIAKGATLYDENTAPTVILPETELVKTQVNEADCFALLTPPNARPEAGKAYTVTVNGTAHTITAKDDNGGVLLIEENEDWMVMYLPDEAAAAMGAHVIVAWFLDTMPDRLTLSIVEAVEESGSAGGGGGQFVVTFSTEDITTNNFTVDKTFAEIQTAFDAGQNIIGEIATVSGDGGSMFFALSMHTPNEKFAFANTYISGNRLVAMQLTVGADDTVTFEFGNYEAI